MSYVYLYIQELFSQTTTIGFQNAGELCSLLDRNWTFYV